MASPEVQSANDRVNQTAQNQSLQKAYREYMESRALAAKPVALVEMLYQVAIRSLDAAIDHLRKGEALARSREVSRSQEAVNELMLSLDRSVGASFTGTLASLYGYVQQQILRGHAQQSEEAFRNARTVLNTLLEAWSGVVEKTSQAAPVSVGQAETAPENPEVETRATQTSGRGMAYQQEPQIGSRGWDG